MNNQLSVNFYLDVLDNVQPSHRGLPFVPLSTQQRHQMQLFKAEAIKIEERISATRKMSESPVLISYVHLPSSPNDENCDDDVDNLNFVQVDQPYVAEKSGGNSVYPVADQTGINVTPTKATHLNETFNVAHGSGSVCSDSPRFTRSFSSPVIHSEAVDLIRDNCQKHSLSLLEAKLDELLVLQDELKIYHQLERKQIAEQLLRQEREEQNLCLQITCLKNEMKFRQDDTG